MEKCNPCKHCEYWKNDYLGAHMTINHLQKQYADLLAEVIDLRVKVILNKDKDNETT